MLNIQFNKNIKITSDDRNYMINIPANPKKNKKTGVELRWKPKYFYSSFADLAAELVEMEIRASDAKTLKELVDDLQAIKTSLARVKTPQKGF